MRSNNQAQQRRGTGELWSTKTNHARPSAAAPGSACLAHAGAYVARNPCNSRFSSMPHELNESAADSNSGISNTLPVLRREAPLGPVHGLPCRISFLNFTSLVNSMAADASSSRSGDFGMLRIRSLSFFAILPAVNSSLMNAFSDPGRIRSAQYTAFHSQMAKQKQAVPSACM